MADFIIRVKVDPRGAAAGGKKVEGSLDRVKKAGREVGKVLQQAFGILAVGAGVGFGVKILAEFSQEMSTVKAITGATGTEFEDLRNKAKELGATTRFSASQAAQGMKFLARAGFDARESVEAVGGTLKLAQAGALDLGTAADIASNVLTGFRLETSETERVVDVLAKTANSANTDVRQLGDGMKLVAPVAAGLKISLEETAAAIGTLSDAGLQGTLAGTGLRRVLSELEAPSTATADRLREMGIQLEEVRPSSVGLTGALQRLKEAGVDTGLALELFGDRGGPASEVLKEMIPRVSQLTAALNNATGTADQISEVMDQNLNGALLAVKSAFEAVILAFGEMGSESALTQFLLNLAKTLRWVAENMDTLATATKVLGVSLAITFAPNLLVTAVTLLQKLQVALVGATAKMIAFSTAQKAMSVGSIQLVGSMSALKVVVGKVGLAFKSLWAIIATNPLLALGAVAIGGTIAAMDHFNRKLDEAISQTERLQKAAIRHRQAMVKEIQERNRNTKNLEAFIQSLVKENQLRTLSTEARREEEAINKALGIAQRALTEDEKNAIIAQVRKQSAIEAANAELKAEQELLKEIIGPQQEYESTLRRLDSLLEKKLITDEQHALALKEINEAYGEVSGEAIQDYIQSLRNENALLQLNAKEQEVRRALLDATAQAEGELSEEQRKLIEGLVREQQAIKASNDETERLKNLLEEIRGPQEEWTQREADLTLLRDQGKISLQQYNEEMEKLKLLQLEMGEDSASGFTRGLMKIKDSLTDVAGAAENLVVNGFRNAEDALVSFVTTGKADFKGLVDSMLADLTRLLVRQALLALIPGGGAIAAGGGAGGGGLGGVALGGFQHGGAFTVPGHGGPDSQTVAFRATPGERVTVQTPQQAAPVVNTKVPLKIVNQVDRSLTLDHMQSDEGEEVFMNFIRNNPSAINRLLGGG